MNKKTKFIAPALCGILLASNLMVASVQAKPTESDTKDVQAISVKSDGKKQTDVKSIVPVDQKYSVYCQLDCLQNISKYIRTGLRDGLTPTSQGVRDILVENGVSKTIANNISYSLFTLAEKNVDFDRFPEMRFGFCDGYKDLVLNAGDGIFTLGSGDASVKSYSLYGIMNNEDLVNLKKVITENPSLSNEKSEAYATRMLIKSNLITDAVMAKKLAHVMENVINTDRHLQKVIEVNEPYYILLSDDKQNIIITRQPK